MWLKAFEFQEKLLSESEFWILTLVSDDFEAPTKIMERLYHQTRDWTPKPGTIYPILHRLTDVGLLEKIDDGGLSFKRSEEGSVFLASIAKPLRVQLFETFNYFERVLSNLANLETPPSRLDAILLETSSISMEFDKNCRDLAEDVKQRMEPTYDVPISFDD